MSAASHGAVSFPRLSALRAKLLAAISKCSLKDSGRVRAKQLGYTKVIYCMSDIIRLTVLIA